MSTLSFFFYSASVRGKLSSLLYDANSVFFLAPSGLPEAFIVSFIYLANILTLLLPGASCIALASATISDNLYLWWFGCQCYFSREFSTSCLMYPSFSFWGFNTAFRYSPLLAASTNVSNYILLLMLASFKKASRVVPAAVDEWF